MRMFCTQEKWRCHSQKTVQKCCEPDRLGTFSTPFHTLQFCVKSALSNAVLVIHYEFLLVYSQTPKSAAKLRRRLLTGEQQLRVVVGSSLRCWVCRRSAYTHTHVTDNRRTGCARASQKHHHTHVCINWCVCAFPNREGNRFEFRQLGVSWDEWENKLRHLASALG